jgi:hypothetical protein
MRVLEILLSKEQRDKGLSQKEKKEVGLLKKKIDQYIDAISKPGTTPTQRASLHKKMTKAVAEVKKITEGRIDELFNNVLPWDWVEQSDDRYKAEFESKGIFYVVYLSRYTPDSLEIEFNSKERKTAYTGKIGITGDTIDNDTGEINSATVFSTVIDVVRSYLKQFGNEIRTLGFSAEEPSRQKLYGSLVRKLLPKWKVISTGHDFELENPNFRGVTEGRIDELFKDPDDWDWDFKGNTECQASFNIDHEFYEFLAYTNGNEEQLWAVEFKSLSGGRFGITGAGNAIRVFATVVDILKDFLSRNQGKVGGLRFSAKEPSRKKLYLRMVKQLIPSWKMREESDTIFVMKPETKSVMEAVHKVPLTEEDFDNIKDLMDRPIPAALSSMYLQEVIIDDELNDMLKSIEDTEPNRDIRPLIAEWIHRVMPDQLWRFGIGEQTEKQRHGVLSPIHGYDPHMYKGGNDPISGNAYGRI